MESRGENNHQRPRGRPAVARRSCDQCRARKIGCDRASPCSNCISARLSCTHSTVASNAGTPKQRILISAQYEQKIDNIAKGIDGIKHLLQRLDVRTDIQQLAAGSFRNADLVEDLTNLEPASASGGEPVWDHSAHNIDFVKTVVQAGRSREIGQEARGVFSALSGILHTLEDTASVVDSVAEPKLAQHTATPLMPPLEAAVAVLRWAKDHKHYSRIAWICQILPLETFTDICQKVYFAVDDYTQADFILANGYLAYTFSEHVVVSGLQDYLGHSHLCRKNLESALSRLPFFLPASSEVIAALTLGAVNGIENSRASVAWTHISAALNLCQTLGYHRAKPERETNQIQQAANESLFWTVYSLEKGLALRLGRSSNILDAEITLPFNPNEPQRTKIARVQGKVYYHLYSPTGLSRPDDERGHLAEALAEELRGLINATHVQIYTAAATPTNDEADPVQILYLQCEVVCQSSLLALVLRAIPIAPSSLSGVSDECIKVARDALDVHQQCMTSFRSCKSDPFMVTKYINWAILHCPFVPFSILFTRAVRLRDVADLALLDRFAASLQPEADSPDSTTHPHRLYELLCQAARLHIESNDASAPTDPTFNNSIADSFGDFDLTHFIETGALADESQAFGLSEWYYGNQQLMNLLDEDVIF